MVYKDFYVNENVFLAVHKYHNGNLAIQMICEDDEPFAMLTVNLDETLPSNWAYVDTNNLSKAIDFITEYKLGEIIGFGYSGFCAYPLVEFNMKEVEKYVK